MRFSRQSTSRKVVENIYLMAQKVWIICRDFRVMSRLKNFCLVKVWSIKKIIKYLKKQQNSFRFIEKNRKLVFLDLDRLVVFFFFKALSDLSYWGDIWSDFAVFLMYKTLKNERRACDHRVWLLEWPQAPLVDLTANL